MKIKKKLKSNALNVIFYISAFIVQFIVSREILQITVSKKKGENLKTYPAVTDSHKPL